MARRLKAYLSRHRLALSAVLFIVLTVAGLAVVYGQFAGHSFRFDARLLAPGTVAAVIALLAVYFTSDGLRLYFTLRALGYKVRAGAMARLVFINLFFSNITPMATGGGLAQIWYLQREGVGLGHATAATTIRTLLAVVFIFSLVPICLLFLPVFHDQPLPDGLAPALSLFVTLYLAFFAVVLFRPRWLIPPIDGLLGLLQRFRLIGAARHRRWSLHLRRELLRFAHSFRHYLRGDLRFVALSVLFTVVFLLSLFSFPWLLVSALGYDVEWLTSFGLLAVTTFIMYFSPTPGASGISEGVFGSFFHPLLGPDHLVLVTVAWRFVTIYLGMLVGLVFVQRDLTAKLRR